MPGPDLGLGWAVRGLVPLGVVLTAAFAPAPADAMDIQRVRSPGGIEAWLVENHANPLIAMRFAFRGGAAQDPTSKEGLRLFRLGHDGRGRRRA